MSKTLSIAIWTTAVLALAAAAVAQTNSSRERLTFSVTNVSRTNVSPDARLDLIINRWSDDGERDWLIAALKDGGQAALASAIGSMQEIGYINFPNYLQYLVRYAARVPRPDGGEDIILGIDRPVNLWWLSDTATGPSSKFTVIQMRLNKDGRGDGRIAMAGKVTAQAQPKALVMEDFEGQPVVFTNVERARMQSSN